MVDQNQVSWQVAWWALVPLTTSAMLQPCGNILGQKSRILRFYARASPIVCIADTTHILFTLLLCLSRRRDKLINNIKYEIGLRFKDNADAQQGDFTSPETSRLWRLIFLGLSGTGCQTVKLVAMRGIPWTQAWALMFFVSIVVGEILIFMAGMPVFRAGAHNDDEALPPPPWRSSALCIKATQLFGSSVGPQQAVPFLLHFFAFLTLLCPSFSQYSTKRTTSWWVERPWPYRV
jgi:hypothetical protein